MGAGSRDADKMGAFRGNERERGGERERRERRERKREGERLPNCPPAHLPNQCELMGSEQERFWGGKSKTFIQKKGKEGQKKLGLMIQ